ncbi:MAG TPA: hypothetical protein P5307_07315, partial [Pirellulaceae bacterium]|nr:hypothetical protein [Pirellulaceae bacterium]
MSNKNAHEFREAVEIRGHIIDSLILPKVLDAIMASGGAFTIESIVVGQTRHDPSFARVVVAAPSAELLAKILPIFFQSLVTAAVAVG